MGLETEVRTCYISRGEGSHRFWSMLPALCSPQLPSICPPQPSSSMRLKYMVHTSILTVSKLSKLQQRPPAKFWLSCLQRSTDFSAQLPLVFQGALPGPLFCVIFTNLTTGQTHSPCLCSRQECSCQFLGHSFTSDSLSSGAFPRATSSKPASSQ